MRIRARPRRPSSFVNTQGRKMPKVKRARPASVPSISAARPEKSKRLSARPKKTNVNKFLNAGSMDPTDRLLLQAAGLWEQLWLTLQASEGPRAIVYGERVSQSLTHLGVQNWMANRKDARFDAERFRTLTSAWGRRLLDALIVEDHTIEGCAQIRFGSTKKLDLVYTRAEIRAYLMAFAALTRLPGAR
jgi:hypothetical protein